MEDDGFETLVVLQFTSSTPTTTKEWVLSRLTANLYEEEGPNLLARFDTDTDAKNNILLIGATQERLLTGAEELRIKKWHKEKGLQEFLTSDINNFNNSENPSDILLKSEKQRIIWEELQNLKPKSTEHIVPGVPNKSIDPENDTILAILQELEFIDGVFPLHDKEEIKRLEKDWFNFNSGLFKSQDLQKIRNYFGENVAFYFAFLEYYTKSLIPPAILGLLLTFWSGTDFFKYALFCIFNVLWWTFMMERWKRLTNRLAYQWGTLDLKVFERPRPLFYGTLMRSPVTSLQERFYPGWKRAVKKYFVTYPIVLACLCISLLIYYKYFLIQRSTNEKYPFDGTVFFIKAKLMRLVPSISYSLLITPINSLYRKIAKILTDFENHRLETSYESNLTAKLFVFFFINCFASLFYEAFFNINYENVAQILTSLVVINVVLSKITDQISPMIYRLIRKEVLAKLVPSSTKSNQAVMEAKTLKHFEGTYGDYLTIFEQYGYVALFSAVFPWITICVLANNVFELRADAFKYCQVYRRPFARLASNIGSWHYAFDILSSVAIVTNTALVAMQPSVRMYFSSYTNVEYILIFVMAEHVLLAAKFAIDFAIPDIPYEVEVARAKALYESNQALRRERERKAKQSSNNQRQTPISDFDLKTHDNL